MADNVIAEPLIQDQSTEQIDVKAQIDQQMAIALNGGIAPQAAEPAAVTTEAAATTTIIPEPSQADPFGIFKEKFGYETPEAAIQEIEQLRAFKAAPTYEGPIVEMDDQVQQLLKAWNAGKKEEVWQALDREVRVERLLNTEVTKETAADIVKMGMQLKYKDLNSDEINHRFNKQYGLPPKPVQAAEEMEEDFQQRLASWQEQVTDKQMDLMIEAKLAKPELQNLKGKLTFPEIKSETSVDEGYAQYLKMLEEQPKRDEEVKAAYRALTPKQVETKINFKDEANKIDFQFQYEPNAEKFAKAQEIASDASQFWKLFTKSDGTPDREGFIDIICYKLDKENYLMSAMNKSKNATIKASLPDNSQPGMLRQMPEHQEPSELDKNMRASLKGYGGY
jgi:hypothetical protein